MATSLDAKYTKGFVSTRELEEAQPQLSAAHELLHTGAGAGAEFTGWLTLPEAFEKAEFSRLKACAARVRQGAEVFVVVGIGGSYLGAFAAMEFLGGKVGPEVHFAGTDMSAERLSRILRRCDGRSVFVNVVSKSGATLESAVAFRVLRQHLEARYGADEAAQRIFCTTDKSSGLLREMATERGYEAFEIPRNVGGRYSVLTPVGLFPLAVAGVDVDALLAGAKEAQKTLCESSFEKNTCYHYALLRYILAKKGKAIELFASFEPEFAALGEWTKQLFGESECKGGKGLFPAYAAYPTDLHSLGQLVQDGPRNLFETVFFAENEREDLVLPSDDQDADGLNYLADRPMSYVKKQMKRAVAKAHFDGGVPNISLNFPQKNEYELGYLFYFLQKACAISCYLQGVNPFDQPGVEAYKREMRRLLGGG